MLRGLFVSMLVICIIIGIICITINLVRLNMPYPETKIVYKYIPKTFEDEQDHPQYASELFKSMFTQQSPWINSVMDYDRRKEESINKYYVSQV